MEDFFTKTTPSDRKSGGGGVMAYVKKCNVPASVIIHDNYEIISFKLHLKSSKSPKVFICAYNSPSADADAFLDYLDTLAHSFNLVDDIFIVGNLNMDMGNHPPQCHVFR